MTIYEQVIQLTHRMTLPEKALLLEHLSSSLRHDIELEVYKTMPWEQFLTLTYGSLADDPIERARPTHSDIRDEIE